MGVAAIGSLLTAKLFGELAARVMPRDESYALTRDALLGLTRKVVFPVSETTGRVHLYDEFHTLHVAPARVAPGSAPIGRGAIDHCRIRRPGSSLSNCRAARLHDREQVAPTRREWVGSDDRLGWLVNLVYLLPAGIAVLVLLIAAVAGAGGDDGEADAGDLGDPGDLDAESLGGDADDSPLGEAGRHLLVFFGAGRIPPSHDPGSLMLGWGLFGLGANEFLRPALGSPARFIAPSLLVAAVGSLLTAKLCLRNSRPG